MEDHQNNIEEEPIQMAVYNDLLLSAGGGVMSTLEKADQQDDTATVLIGLGGTGVHALRTVKTQVYQRLKYEAI